MDEAHLQLPASLARVEHPATRQNIGRIKKRAQQAEDSVLLFFTATPIARDAKEAVEFLDIIRGDKKESYEGYVSYFIARPKGVFPDHVPAGYLPMFKYVDLKGTALIKALEAHGLRLDADGTIKTKGSQKSISTRQGYLTVPTQYDRGQRDQPLPVFELLKEFVEKYIVQGGSLRDGVSLDEIIDHPWKKALKTRRLNCGRSQHRSPRVRTRPP